MKQRVIAALLAGLLVLGMVGSALADGNNPQNPGGATTGYEGQPGNQSHH
jgi:F0F1-type ATP synthase membrane subunit c/vacuolar-type H+-ATPase subunit K